jgi:hypothetical protein
MRAGIDDAFTTANAGIDSVVRSSTKVGTEETETRGLIDASLAQRVARVDGVATAIPNVDARPDRRRRRRPARRQRSAHAGGSWITDDAINPWDLVEDAHRGCGRDGDQPDSRRRRQAARRRRHDHPDARP